MKCRCRQPARPTRPTGLPPYLEPGLTLGTCSVTFRNFSLSGSVVTTVAPANPNRVAIGFAPPASGVMQLLIWPQGGTANNPFHSFVAVTHQWYKLFDYGPIVNLPWLSSAAGAGILQVIEVIRVN